MDSYFRTYEGFQMLIEKEWLSFGYPFESRASSSGAGAAPPTSAKSGKFQSPVFIMFLDCVWQCLQQYPCAFEFNEAFLLALAEHSQASRFGTYRSSIVFLCADNDSLECACGRIENMCTFVLLTPLRVASSYVSHTLLYRLSHGTLPTRLPAFVAATCDVSGTFLCDCQKDREAAGVAEKTLSFWA